MTNTNAMVDVIILSWGRIPDTCAAIDSALAQEGVIAHVILIDQGTPATELEVLKRHVAGRPQVTLVCNSENRGVPGGRNQGSAIGKALYIVALDNDAEFASPFELAKAVAIMEEDKSIAALAFRILLYSTGGDDASSWPYPLSMRDHADKRFNAARFVGAGHMLRRNSFEVLDGYDAALFFLHEEVDLAYRLMNLGQSVVYDPTVAVLHKVSPENRVSWNGRRYYFHVRNTIYMAAKYNFSPASSTLNVVLALSRGIRSGFILGTLRGLLDGLGLIPRGLKQRWSDSRVKLSADTLARIKAISPTRDMSLMQRLRYRVARSTRPT